MLAWKPPQLFEFTWGEDEYGLRLELEREGDGCRLYLSNPFDESREQALRNISGWHVCVAALEAALSDQPMTEVDAWHKQYAEYSERF